MIKIPATRLPDQGRTEREIARLISLQSGNSEWAAKMIYHHVIAELLKLAEAHALIEAAHAIRDRSGHDHLTVMVGTAGGEQWLARRARHKLIASELKQTNT